VPALQLALAPAAARDEEPLGREARAQVPLGGDDHAAALEHAPRARQVVAQSDADRLEPRRCSRGRLAGADAPLPRPFGVRLVRAQLASSSSAPLSSATSADASASRMSPAIMP